MDWSVPCLISCYDMVHYLAGGAIVYALDSGPTGGEPEDSGGREMRKLDLRPQKGSDSACPLEAAVGLGLEKHQGCGVLSGPHPRSHFQHQVCPGAHGPRDSLSVYLAPVSSNKSSDSWTWNELAPE